MICARTRTLYIGPAADISFTFDEVGLAVGGGAVDVRDIWANAEYKAVKAGSFTAKSVPHHGTALLRLSKAKRE